MSFSNLINELHNAQSQAFHAIANDTSIENERNEISQILVDLSKCAEFVIERYEGQLYDLAMREIQHSMLAAFGASYRQAFMGLRLALEHWFTGINFSTNELQFKAWQLDESDVSWAELNNEETGILSERFVHYFWPETEQHRAAYQNLAKKLYRECSEYVHGNLKTHTTLPKQIEYDKVTFLSWKEKLDALKLLFIYSFVVRFSSSIRGHSEVPCAQVLLDNIGHLPEARELF